MEEDYGIEGERGDGIRNRRRRSDQRTWKKANS